MRKAGSILFEALESRMLLSTSPEIIAVGDHVLEPNKPNQRFQVLISGDQQVPGVDIFAQVADGGPAQGGQISGPAITSIDILTGTIFAGNNVGPEGQGSQTPQLYGELFTITAHDTVLGTGVLATVTVDTTGFTSGTWDFKLAGTVKGDSDLAGVPVTINNGHISISGNAGGGTGGGTPTPAEQVALDRTALKTAQSDRKQQLSTLQHQLRTDLKAYATAKRTLLTAQREARKAHLPITSVDPSLTTAVNEALAAVQQDQSNLKTQLKTDFTGIATARKNLATDLVALRNSHKH